MLSFLNMLIKLLDVVKLDFIFIKYLRWFVCD